MQKKEVTKDTWLEEFEKMFVQAKKVKGGVVYKLFANAATMKAFIRKVEAATEKKG